tara:strand:+ start:2723 stop:3577 length:855 start_codon:yes stop_codon:yes gene_type:complete
MSTGLSTAFITLFEAEVKQAYQGDAVLRDSVRMRTNVEGSTVKFPKIGKGTAQIRTPQTDVVPLNTSFSTVTATMENYIAAEYSDIFDQAKVNFDERQELAQVVGKAIARREDQIIIDVMEAASPGSTIANTVVTSGSAGASDLNIGKIIAAKKALDAANVPPTDRHAVIHANSLAGLLGDERAISGDFQNIKALVAGDLNTMMGFQFHIVGDRDEGGLAIDGSSDRGTFFYHKSAIGCGVGIPPKVEVNYVPEKTSFLVSAMYSAGAVAIDTAGLIKVTCRES